MADRSGWSRPAVCKLLWRQLLSWRSKEDGSLEKEQNRQTHPIQNQAPSQKNNSTRSKAQIKRREHDKSSVRAKVEHVFAVVKKQLRFRKTRYRGLQKQIAKMNMLFALSNLWLWLAGKCSPAVRQNWPYAQNSISWRLFSLHSTIEQQYSKTTIYH